MYICERQDIRACIGGSHMREELPFTPWPDNMRTASAMALQIPCTCNRHARGFGRLCRHNGSPFDGTGRYSEDGMSVQLATSALDGAARASRACARCVCILAGAGDWAMVVTKDNTWMRAWAATGQVLHSSV